MRMLIVLPTTLLVASILALPAHADQRFGLGMKVGTLGAGIEGSWQPLPWLDLRAGGNFYDFEDSGTQAGINYEGELNLQSYYGTANFHFPFSPFRITAGAFANGNELNLASTDNTSMIIGGTEYLASDVGTLRGNAAFEGTAPYLGLGFDFTVLRKVGLNLDLGVLWQGEPEVAMTADGPIASDPGFQQSLEVERMELEDEVSDFKVWPVVSLGFVFNF